MNEKFTECPRCDWESPIWESWQGSESQVAFYTCPNCNYPKERDPEDEYIGSW